MITQEDQPMPTPGRTDVPPVLMDWFVRDLADRDRKGRETYGTPLQTHNGRDAGRDAWEELIDLAQYLTQLRLEHLDALAELEKRAAQDGEVARLTNENARLQARLREAVADRDRYLSELSTALSQASAFRRQRDEVSQALAHLTGGAQ